MRANIRLLAWAGLGIAVGIVFIVVAVHGGGFAVVPAAVPYPPMKPDIKVWDATDGKTEP